jgi:hypothetical protein
VTNSYGSSDRATENDSDPTDLDMAKLSDVTLVVTSAHT